MYCCQTIWCGISSYQHPDSIWHLGYASTCKEIFTWNFVEHFMNPQGLLNASIKILKDC